ncbi:uncharacterized protein BDR25DRAFT_237538 [Lindgomyces ingoldianus]|uniref:Uncharacterized protein n=1 Tax=Lindgomyces ingoldianus TaxID=673940 RepID=A0ACB6QHS0_9PLEO|nr:uncharacterized protein BDR25DRAFT_237538 [Lindgomyces ingoldianus]KAF2466425.1 hypothetical protein BDR25DRAFT_237538 [Lindgomyces ingoldianus]
MAPLDPDVTARTNTIPLATFSGQVLLVACLATNILLTIRRAARALPPPSSTRAQEPVRRRNVAVFSVLALLSLASVTTFAVAWRVLSYFDWAEKGNHETPGSLWTGWYGTGDEGVSRWRLGDWVRDIDLAREADGLAVNSPEGFLYTSQQFVGLVAASIFMGVEGRKRTLPALAIASFVALSTIGSLGFALNLFFIAMLFTPVALHSDGPLARDTLFTPKSAVYGVPIVASFLLLHSLPWFLARGSDITLMRFGYFAIPPFLAFAPQIIPTSWGHEHTTKASAHRSYRITFYILGVTSLLLHWKLGVTSLSNDTPSEQASAYDLLTNAVGKQDNSNRFVTALSNTVQKLKFVSRHPAISVTASDVLLTSISLCIWAFLRNLDVDDVLENSFLSFLASSKAEKHVAFEDKVEKVEDKAPPAGSPVKRGRGRPRKNGALTNSTRTASASSASSLRRSTRRKTRVDFESDMEDSYEPSEQAATEVKQIESDGSMTSEGVVQGGESAALALFLALIGGLGQLGAGVLGAEVTGTASSGV